MERYGEGKPINIIYASNDGYACHLGASLYSLLDNNRSIPRLEIYVLSVGMSRRFENRLKAIGARFGRQVHMAEMGELRKRFPYEVDTRGFDISAMARLFAPEVLPASVDRALYLDCDTVVIRRLKNMWEIDLDGNIAGAVQEPTIYPEVKEDIGLKKADPYYNAGVLLIDLEKWRAEDTGRRLMEYYESRGGKLFANDQDAINHVLKGRIRSIMPIYNFFPNYRYFHYKDLVNRSEAYAQISKSELHRAKHHPVIIHYMGDERPWKAGNLNHYRRAYEIYLEKTPWKGAAKEKGQELYMLAYHAMDYATFLCPPVRRMISRKYLENSKKNGKGV